MRTRKIPRAGKGRRGSSFMFIGLLTSLAMTLVAFEWTTFEDGPREMTHLYLDFLEEEVIPPSAPLPPPPPPPPSPTTLFEIIDEWKVMIEEVKVVIPELTTTMEVTPIKPPEELVDEEEILYSAERMPAFPGCEDLSTEEERIQCSNEGLFRFLGRNIKYPLRAQETGLSGIVYITYVVDRNGKITDVQVLKGVGGGLDEEAVRVVRSLPDWTPGKHRGSPVKVRYMLPVRFSLR